MEQNTQQDRAKLLEQQAREYLMQSKDPIFTQYVQQLIPRIQKQPQYVEQLQAELDKSVEYWHQRQKLNESNRIRQEKRLIVPRIYTADTGLQCGEQHIFFHDRLLRELSELLYHAVQYRRLSRIGIAHQCHLRSPAVCFSNA